MEGAASPWPPQPAGRPAGDGEDFSYLRSRVSGPEATAAGRALPEQDQQQALLHAMLLANNRMKPAGYPETGANDLGVPQQPFTIPPPFQYPGMAVPWGWGADMSGAQFGESQ